MSVNKILCAGFLIVALVGVQAAEWEPVTGKKALRAIYDNTVVEGKRSSGEYCADGSGLLYAWGETFPRTWKIKGNEQACVSSEDATTCYTFEQDRTNPKRYRARNVATDERTVFEISYRKPKSCAK